MNHEELKQDLLDAYNTAITDMAAAAEYTKYVGKDLERVEEAKKALAAYEKEHNLV